MITKIFTAGICIVFLCSRLLNAQTSPPELISYQGIARDANGNPLANQTIAIQLKIHQGTTNGAVVCIENYTVPTNSLGLFTLQIGSNNPSDFQSIPWNNGPYFLEVLIAPNVGSSYTSIGTQQLLSVPYALYSKKSKNSDSSAIAFASFTTQNVPPISISTNTSSTNFTLNIQQGTSTNTSVVIDFPPSPSPSISITSASPSIVSVFPTSGNAFTISATSPSFTSSDGITNITGTYPNYTITTTPSLSISGNNLSISGGNTVPLPTAPTPTITGQGIANVLSSSANSFTVDVPSPTLNITNGASQATISIYQGTAISTQTLIFPSNTHTITGSGIAAVTPTTGNSFTVNVPSPTLSAYTATNGITTITINQGSATNTATFDLTPAIQNKAWSLSGNAISTTTNFLGTTNNHPLIFKTNNKERIRISNTGNTSIVGDNTSPILLPEALLHLRDTIGNASILKLGHANNKNYEWFFEIKGTSPNTLALSNENNGTSYSHIIFNLNNSQPNIDIGPTPHSLTTRITNTASNGTALYINNTNTVNTNPVFHSKHYNVNNGTNALFEGGNVGIGQTSFTPNYPLHVSYTGTNTAATRIEYNPTTISSGAPSGLYVTTTFTGTTNPNVFGGYFQTTGSSSANTSTGIYAFNTSTISASGSNFGIQSLVKGNADTLYGIYSEADGSSSTSTNNYGVYTFAKGKSGSNNSAVYGEIPSTTLGNFNYAVVGKNFSTSGTNYGGYFETGLNTSSGAALYAITNSSIPAVVAECNPAPTSTPTALEVKNGHIKASPNLTLATTNFTFSSVTSYSPFASTATVVGNDVRGVISIPSFTFNYGNWYANDIIINFSKPYSNPPLVFTSIAGTLIPENLLRVYVLNVSTTSFTLRITGFNNISSSNINNLKIYYFIIE